MIFREMRRSRQALSLEECKEILTEGSSGVLALAGDGGYPYAVPLSYVYDGNEIYFHCAKEGHKLDAIARCSKASFCVIQQDLVVPEKFTTYYRSVIVFGQARVVETDREKRQVLELLAKKYSPKETEKLETEIKGAWNHVCTVALSIDHISGKRALELS